MTSNEVGKRELCKTNVTSIPSPGLGRLRVGGLALQGGTLHLDEFFLCTSLDTVISYFEEHHAFPKEWLEMQTFFEKVFSVFCFLLLHDVIVVVFK
jgi:hypothetical protein